MVRDVEDKIFTDGNNIHLAGIIPLCGQQYRKRKLPWHPGLLPLEEDILLIDLAIAQCAYVGCDTIWIVVDDYLEPYFRERVGEYVQDPIKYGLNPYKKGMHSGNKTISIYYVPESYDDRDRRDSVSFQCIRGMEMARKITGQISSFVIPDRYFVTFPYAVAPYLNFRKFRNDAYGGECIFTQNGRSIKTGDYMPFVIDFKTAKLCKEWVWHNSTGYRDMSQPKEEWQFGSIPTKELPTKERYSGRWFGPDKVFKVFHEKQLPELELEWYYDVSSFDTYREYMGSDKKLGTLDKKLFMKKTWNSMSFDDAEFEEE